MACKTYKIHKPNRKTPNFKPASCGAGTKRPGANGKMYIVKLTKKGTYKWKRLGKRGSSKKRSVSKKSRKTRGSKRRRSSKSKRS